MASVNKAIILGNLGNDPDMRYLPSGDAVANLSIATTEKFKDKSGQMQDVTEWHRVSFFGKTAEVCGQYLKKGSSIYIEGSIRTRKWQDKDGNDRYTTEIRGDRMQMLGGKPAGGASQAPAQAAPASAPEMAPAGVYTSSFADIDSDIPFIDGSASCDAQSSLERRMRRYGRKALL